MQYFNFKWLIERYKCEFTAFIEPTEGTYDDKGDYVQAEKIQKTFMGAIISHKTSKIYRAEGTLTEKDKQLFMLEPIERAFCNAFIFYKNNKYRIESELDNAEFTGVYAYNLKWISAFDEKELDDFECLHEKEIDELEQMIDESGVLND